MLPEEEMAERSYGLNIDGNGNVVGLWFVPGVIERDENDYWFVSLAQIEELEEEAYSMISGDSPT